jgi:alkylation response protein AidB-like acyl-CoA dehydrogenase
MSRRCSNRTVRDARVPAIGGGATEVMLEEVLKRLGG